MDPRGSLFWPEERLLVISDLHLEKGSSFAAHRGVFLPPYDTHTTLEALALCITDWQPVRVVSLGDSFHDESASTRLPQSCKLRLRQLMENRDWIWVSGNHDPKPPEDIGGTFCSELQIGALNFIHEPRTIYRDGEIAGHLHPCAKIRRRGKTVRRRCFVADDKRMILPAFGAFTGGLNVRNEAFDGLFENHLLRAWMLSGAEVYAVNGKALVR